MLQLAPSESWSTILAMLAVAITVTWLIYELLLRGDSRGHERPEAKSTATESSTPVPARQRGHLRLVTSLPRERQTAPYDWQKQGL